MTVDSRPQPTRGWVRFMPQSTHYCVRLPDGRIFSTAYGVGGSGFFFPNAPRRFSRVVAADF